MISTSVSMNARCADVLGRTPIGATRPVAFDRQSTRTGAWEKCPVKLLRHSGQRHSCTAIRSLTSRAEDVTTKMLNDDAVRRQSTRTTLRMGLPSKGRMAEDTKKLLTDSALTVKKPNPRQYVGTIPQIPELEVWFQRATDVVRKLSQGDLDLGIVGHDMFAELADNDPNLVIVHDALNFGQCKLALGIPMSGKFLNIESLDALRDMPEWTADTPLRVVTGYHNVARRYFAEKGFEHVVLLSADGALEAAPAMGSADIILDLSEGILVANRKALLERPGLLEVVHELIERFDAHLKAEMYYSVTVNMKGNSPEEIATNFMAAKLAGLSGPTIAKVYNKDDEVYKAQTYAATICVCKKELYSAIKTLQKIGARDVLVLPMTYIFDEEPQRWTDLVQSLDLEQASEIPAASLN
eukprot:gene20883-27727_t